MQIGSVLFALIVVGVCLPILDPFLQQGITATGGITAILLMAIPFFLVGAIVLRLFRETPPTQQGGW